MPELTDSAKLETQRYIDDRQHQTDQKNHTRFIRWASISGIVAGSFFALLAGATTFLISNIQQSAKSTAKEVAREELKEPAIVESLKQQQKLAQDATSAARVAAGTALGEAQVLKDRTSELKEQLETEVQNARNAVRSAEEGAEKIHAESKKLDSDLRQSIEVAQSSADMVVQRSEKLLKEIRGALDDLENRKEELEQLEGVLSAAKSLGTSQKEIVSAAINDPAFRQAIADRASPVPANAVVAFSLEKGCPEGWSNYSRGYSKFIVGATPEGEEHLAQVVGFSGPRKLSPRQYGSQEGEEMVTLSAQQMPSHFHDSGWGIWTSGPRGRGKIEVDNGQMGFDPNNAQRTAVTGGDANGRTVPHNNMPPYIALYFCKKE